MTLARRTPLRSRSRLATRQPGAPTRQPGADVPREVREAVRDRVGGWCQARIPDVCTGRGSHAHHLLRRGQGGTHTEDNLAWLCGACHGHVHRRIRDAELAGLLRPRHMSPPWVWTPDSLDPAPWPVT